MYVLFQDKAQWYGCYYYSNNLWNSSSKTSGRFGVRLVRRVKRRFMNGRSYNHQHPTLKKTIVTPYAAGGAPFNAWWCHSFCCPTLTDLFHLQSFDVETKRAVITLMCLANVIGSKWQEITNWNDFPKNSPLITVLIKKN